MRKSEPLVCRTLLGYGVPASAGAGRQTGWSWNSIPARLPLSRKFPVATKSQLLYGKTAMDHQSCTDSAAGDCPQPFVCPLNLVRAGTAVRIKQLPTSPEVTHRLREMGFCEEQKIKLLSQQTNVICQVCNVRLGISAQLASQILVEPLVNQRVA
jgi:Fe2+ transport system protein FeoA